MFRPIPVLPGAAAAKALAFLKNTGPSAPGCSVSLGSVDPTTTARELVPYCAVFAPLEIENGSPDMFLLKPCRLQPPSINSANGVDPFTKRLPLPNANSKIQF